MTSTVSSISETSVRVNYSEIDQMGVVYHARYLVWLDVARCEHLRLSGMSYRELEQAGLRLAVSELAIRYRQPARYDDLIRIRCWIREVASRRVDFWFVLANADEKRPMGKASPPPVGLVGRIGRARLPEQVRPGFRPL